MTRFASSMIVIALAACGGGSGGGGTNQVTPEQADALCTRGCNHIVTCGGSSTLPECVADCTGDTQAWRQDALLTLVDCLETQMCSDAPEACFAEIDPLPIHEEWETKCRAQLATCVTDPTQLDGFCEVNPDPANPEVGFIRVIAPAIMNELIACLDQPDCTTRQTCLQSVADAHNINF